jgi:formate dehydrogenase major subunit
VPGLGARLGRGAATTPQQSLADSDCIVIMGANMAENHPVGFRFVMKAKERGATVIHIDPRFSRTSALADMHVPLRAGSDLVLLGALVNYTIEHEKYFRDYVLHYTNAATLINPGFLDTEDLDGLFSGYDPETEEYSTQTWQYAGHEGPASSSTEEPSDDGAHPAQTAEPRTQHVGRQSGPTETDPTLEDPQCVFQIVRRHFARYTPEMVEQSCGIPRDLFLKVAEAITSNSNRERTTAFCYAVAWTQHTTGTQIIGCCALLQLLLGNIGRPGGGILALRGHSTIQGSTDIPTLYNLLPGYLPMPSAKQNHTTLQAYLESETPPTGAWHDTPRYVISLLKAWYGERATPDNDFAYDLLPKIGADYSFQPMMLMMKDGTMKGLFCMGQNPAVGGMNAVLARQALANLDWLVVRDIHEVETAAFWYDAPEVRSGEVRPQDINTEIFFLPASVSAEKEGTLTNTQRLVQWHDKAVEPPGDARSEAGFMYDLGLRLKELYRDDHGPLGRQINALQWQYPTQGAHAEPAMEAIDREINGYTVADGKPVPGMSALRDDGTTACGCWIYSGIMPEEGINLARGRVGDDQAALGWGFAWPANRRILYNRASADPSGKPWSERKKWIWWDERQGRWSGFDVPDFPATKRPDYQPPAGAQGLDAHSGDAPFVNMADGKGWLFASSGLRDGPLPTHYEPWESPVPNLLYPAHPVNPTALRFPRSDNVYHQRGDPRYPYVITTYRLTEHHTAGGMSRWVPWLAELQPEGFAEISTELAQEHAVANGDWVTLTTARGEISTRALVTERMQPLTIDGRTVHQIGMPYHFGFGGLAKGGIANDLSALIEDPNSRIHQAKAFTCGLRKGRLPHEPVTNTDQPLDESNV